MGTRYGGPGFHNPFRLSPAKFKLLNGRFPHYLEKHGKQREISFWKPLHKKHQSTSASGRNGLYGPSRIPPCRFGTVELLLRLRHTKNNKICEQATQHDTFIERSNSHLVATRQYESDNGAQTSLLFHSPITHNTVTDGFPGQPGGRPSQHQGTVNSFSSDELDVTRALVGDP